MKFDICVLRICVMVRPIKQKHQNWLSESTGGQACMYTIQFKDSSGQSLFQSYVLETVVSFVY